MSQELTLKLNEKIFAAIQSQARTIGVSPEQLAATLLEHQFSQALKLLLDESQKHASRSKFERHFGTLETSGSLDNESIDADLAKEYASTNERE